jgi:predicted dehydrogenase
MFKIGIFGCGGRIISLLNNEMFKVLSDKNIGLNEFSIVAIYDPNFYQVVNTLDNNYANFKKMIENTKIYTGVEDEEKVYMENEFDVSIIASRNDKHYPSLILANKYNKNIFCEKPVATTIEQINELLQSFKSRNTDLFFQTGLVLRYTNICTESKKYLSQIGELNSVEGCEFLDIGHGGQIIMKNWRRLKSISGGLGLEKCVHDYDLIFHFVESVFDVPIDNVIVSSHAQNTFWIKSRRDEIWNQIESTKELSHAYHKWDNRTFQRIVNDPFECDNLADLIPDQQQVLFKICTEQKEIPINFNISIGAFRSKTERCYHFSGTKGDCVIDIINLKILLTLHEEEPVIVHFENNDSTYGSHAGGDYYVIQTLINLMSGDKNEVVTFNESIRSTVIGCLAEKSIDSGEQIYLA